MIAFRSPFCTFLSPFCGIVNVDEIYFASESKFGFWFFWKHDPARLWVFQHSGSGIREKNTDTQFSRGRIGCNVLNHEPQSWFFGPSSCLPNSKRGYIVLSYCSPCKYRSRQFWRVLLQFHLVLFYTLSVYNRV